MADVERDARNRRPIGRGLAAALRREAAAERPAFSTALHGRIVAAVTAASRPVPERPAPRRPTAPIGGLLATAACVAIAVVFMAARPATPPVGASVADGARVSGPGIERLPTPGEIGAGVMAEVTTLAAAAIGMPEWTDLAGFDPVAFSGADDAGR